MSRKILVRFASVAVILGLGLAVGCGSQPVPQCAFNAACNDGDPCTADACIDQRCVNVPIEDCTAQGSSCEANADCPGLAICEDNTCVAVECLADTDCRGDEVCQSNACVEEETGCTGDTDCDDGVFCNGAEQCNVDGECITGSPRCQPLLCDESAQACVECLADSDCDADEVCEDGACAPATECLTDDHCDDGMFCNGVETCTDGLCEPGPSPCGAGQTCDEEGNRCWDDALTLDLGGGVTMELVLISPGTFMMGSDSKTDSIPVHSVTINYYFYLGRYEVTQDQWLAVMGDNPSSFGGSGDLPVESMTWDEATAFCTALSGATSHLARLPTEAEWEYACRAGTTTRYYFGDSPDDYGDYAWYEDNSMDQTHEVGSKLANAWGLYDTYGNVWEYCADSWHGNYTGAPSDGSAWTEGGHDRVVRGSSFVLSLDVSGSAERGWMPFGNSSNALGFRVAVDFISLIVFIDSE